MNAREYYRSIAADRNDWAETRPQMCMFCWKKKQDVFRKQLEVHEIERRSHAANNWWHRSNALLLCQNCHATRFASMPHAWQLAVKKKCDPEYFDLQAWLKVGGRPDSYVTIEDVEAAYRDLYVTEGQLFW